MAACVLMWIQWVIETYEALEDFKTMEKHWNIPITEAHGGKGTIKYTFTYDTEGQFHFVFILYLIKAYNKFLCWTHSNFLWSFTNTFIPFSYRALAIIVKVV